MIRKTLLTVLFLALFAPVFATGALSVSEAAPIEVGDRLLVQLTGEEAGFAFTPAANSAYTVYFFPEEGERPPTDARLYRDGAMIAHGGGAQRLLEARLSAGENYTLTLSGETGGVLEIMRATLGRSFERPISLDGAQSGYEKLLVRAGDAHWYCFTALDDGPVTVHARPGEIAPERSAPLLKGILTDASGRTLAAAEGDANGFFIEYELAAGAVYYVRVSAAGDTTGAYTLWAEQDAVRARRPESLALSAQTLVLEVGQTHALSAAVLPEGAHPAVFFSSSDSGVVSVSQSGEVRARAAGEAVVTARAWGGVSASCVVTVDRVPLSGIGFSQSELTLRVGESVGSALEFYPADASDRRVDYAVTEGAEIVSVSRDGVVTGLSEGAARVAAVARDGGHTDILDVTVEPAAGKLRALLVGQQLYHESVNKVRVGSINTAQSMAAMLESQIVEGESYQSRVLLDTTRSETLFAIRETFAEAQEGDISLFYITCHGYYEHGMSFFQLYDGSLICARDLERELRRIPGTVVVVADCCGSGGLVGKASSLADFNRGILSVFGGRVDGAPLAASKYKVIASASLDQDSYRISFDENVTESDMATVLARALCDGAGWSLTNARRAALRADSDYDRRITLNEIYQYVSRRVTWYLNLAGRLAGAEASYAQNVQVYPQGDPFVLLGR